MKRRMLAMTVLMLGLTSLQPLLAQPPSFVQKGRIEFERKFNMQELFKDWSDNGFVDALKKSVPNFKSDFFDLSFDSERTLYQPGRENPDNTHIPEWFQDQPAGANVVFHDLVHHQTISQKKVYDQTFLITDSVRKIKWKITDETRQIAGFSCRRANGIIMDSLYVVAFYTDDIPSSGGPESFGGLPGMILGVALPYEHVSWFATKVVSTDPKGTELAAPAKGKKVNRQQLYTLLQDRMKDWGKNGQRTLRTVML